MSRISVYAPQIAVPQLSGPPVQEINVSGGILNALGSVTTALGAREKERRAAALQPAAAVVKKEELDANVYVANALAKLAARGLEHAASNEDLSPGHTLIVGKEFDHGASDALANAPNDLAKLMLTRELPRVQLQVHKAAVLGEVSANLAKRYADAMETLDIFGDLVKADPSQLPERMAESLALGENLFLASAERAVYNAKRRELPLIALSSAIDHDPQSALAEIKDGQWSDYVDQETLAQMKDVAERRIAVDEATRNAAKSFEKEDHRLRLGRAGQSRQNWEDPDIWCAIVGPPG